MVRPLVVLSFERARGFDCGTYFDHVRVALFLGVLLGFIRSANLIAHHHNDEDYDQQCYYGGECNDAGFERPF